MKCVKIGSEIIRVSEAEADALVRNGATFVNKQMWRTERARRAANKERAKKHTHKKSHKK